jgi:endo-1,4-beta-xylanase
MKKLISLTAAICLLSASCTPNRPGPVTLKDAFRDKFLIGTAMNTEQTGNDDTSGVKVIKEQFSTIVAENCMKSMYLQPEPVVNAIIELTKENYKQ